jgi:hypothetical protein
MTAEQSQALVMAMLSIEPTLALRFSQAELLEHALELITRLKILGHMEASTGDRE